MPRIGWWSPRVSLKIVHLENLLCQSYTLLVMGSFFNSWTLRMCRYSIVTCFSIFAHSPPLFRKCFHPFFLLSCIFSVEYVPLFFLEVVDFPCVIQGRTVKRFYEMTKNYFKLCIFINLNSEESQFFFSKDFKDFAFSWQSVQLNCYI